MSNFTYSTHIFQGAIYIQINTYSGFLLNSKVNASDVEGKIAVSCDQKSQRKASELL